MYNWGRNYPQTFLDVAIQIYGNVPERPLGSNEKF